MYNKDFTYPAGSVGFDAATSRYDPSMHVQAKQINGSPVAFVFGVADIVGKSSFVLKSKKTLVLIILVLVCKHKINI